MAGKIKKYFCYSYWSNKITNSIFSNVPQAKESDREKIEYGAYMALSESTKIGFLLVLSGILHVFWYVFGIIMIFGLLRWNLGGIHAKTHWACMISYTGFIYGILAVSMFLKTDRLILELLVLPFALLVTYLYAPADMPVKPVVSKKQKKRLRISSFVLLVLFSSIAPFLPQIWFNIIMLTIALTTVLMTPPVYKLTGNKYGREEVAI